MTTALVFFAIVVVGLGQSPQVSFWITARAIRSAPVMGSGVIRHFTNFNGRNFELRWSDANGQVVTATGDLTFLCTGITNEFLIFLLSVELLLIAVIAVFSFRIISARAGARSDNEHAISSPTPTSFKRKRSCRPVWS